MDAAIRLLEDYIFEEETRQKMDWPLYFVKEDAYNLWSAKTLLSWFKQNPKENALEISEGFYYKMIDLSKKTDNRELNFLFDVAADFAESTINMLL